LEGGASRATIRKKEGKKKSTIMKGDCFWGGCRPISADEKKVASSKGRSYSIEKKTEKYPREG